MLTESSVHRGLCESCALYGSHALPGLLRSQALLRVNTRRPAARQVSAFPVPPKTNLPHRTTGKFLSVALTKSDLWPGEPGPLHGFARYALRA